MGAMNSCCIPRKSCDCGTGLQSSTPKGKGHRRNLSDTFNLSVIEEANHKTGGVNINVASEEEFMTLPGIDRTIAKNIIDYRGHIGGFRCVEDLALASGVGAQRLSQIRRDIYVLNSPNNTHNWSSNSVSTQTRCLYTSDLVNLNVASVSDLVKIKRIGSILAESIVDYRNKNGKFRSLEELANVKGIGPATVQQIKPYLAVEENCCNLHDTASPQANGKIGGKASPNRTHNNNRLNVERSSMENVMESLSPKSKPERPKTGAVSLKHNNQPVVRIASWNLERFNLSKAKHPGVKDIVCMTIIENRLGIVAFQELTNKDALSEICEELNHPSLPNVKKWKGRKGHWGYVVSEKAGMMHQGVEYSGFLYDKSQSVEFISSSLLNKKDKATSGFTRRPFLASFKINNAFDCILISVHLKAKGLRNEDLNRTQEETDRIKDVVKAAHRYVKDENDVIILGDFNLDAAAADFEPLRNEGYVNCIPASSFTNISKSSPQGTKSYDNIWVNKQTQQVLAGDGQVIREGLWSPWIPYDWGWGGYASNHCPVFTELYTSRDLDNGNLHQARTALFTLGKDVATSSSPLLSRSSQQTNT